MYSTGCPRAPPPPLQMATFASTWIGGTSSILSMASDPHFSRTCSRSVSFGIAPSGWCNLAGVDPVVAIDRVTSDFLTKPVMGTATRRSDMVLQ